MNILKNKCLVWDFDNTLAKRDGLWSKSLMNVLSSNGHKNIDQNVISNYLKNGFPWHRYDEAHHSYMDNGWWQYIKILITKALSAVGINEDIDKLTKELKDEYMRIEAWSLFDETIESLEISRNKGYANIILSNHIPELEDIIEDLGLLEYFEAVFTFGKVGYEKPNKRIFEELYKNYRYEKYYMIGDSYKADIIGAQNVGFSPILVRSKNDMNYEKYAQGLFGIWRYIE